MSDMESHFELALIAILACVIVYSLLTKSISRTVLTLPIIFVFVGLAASGQIEMLAPPEVLDGTKRLLAEITLVLVLFADASHVRINKLKANFQLPLRMLVIGMPLTIGLGTVVVYLINPTSGMAMALFGWGLARAMNSAHERDTISPSAHAVVFLTTAFAAFIAAEIVGGNGFIAAFVAGAAFGNTYRYDIHFISEFMESQGQLLTMAAFFVFGALMLPDGFAHMTWSAVAVALLFLTVVRMGPIWLSLLGTGLALRQKLFLGWFGPRGLASILFALIMIDEFDLPNEQELLACVSMTVFFVSHPAWGVGHTAGTADRAIVGWELKTRLTTHRPLHRMPRPGNTLPDARPLSGRGLPCLRGGKCGRWAGPGCGCLAVWRAAR